MRRSQRGHIAGAVLFALTVAAAGTVQAGGACDFVTAREASRILGAPAGKRLAQAAYSKDPGCIIESADGSGDRLTLSIETIAPEDAPRLLQHVDDERGDERPSMHGETWFEVSVPDVKHPHYRRMIVHRDRTSLILDLQSTHQKDAKAVFEKVWFKISERLPTDEAD